MKKQFVIFITLFISLQNCASYEKTPVTLEKAQRKGKVKIIYGDGQEKHFREIVLRDSVYYGGKYNSTNDYVFYPFEKENIQQVYLKKVRMAKNVFYSSLYVWPMYGDGISFYYERKIGESIWATTGVGKSTLHIGTKIDCKLTYLSGTGSSHLELAAGFSYTQKKATESYYNSVYGGWLPGSPATSYIHPAFTLGYRYQKPGSGLVFRAGVGYAEFNIGLGFNF